ncbi:hypothetical protein [Wielerella bovis]|uniref:hypothetical protein n=1 Tax=Wielerella bovis TaxID=2917790 RepID=UPI00201897E8|nr:hypothetical protein [Wielerella bovis]ULJ59668.1 hypothetical protein MIS44_08255 [Wielerella bovis]
MKNKIKFTDVIRFILFLLIIYLMHNVTYNVNLEKSTSETGMEMATDTYETLEKIATELKSSFHKGQVRYAESKRWTHVNGSFQINKCIDYYDLKEIIVNSGFKHMGHVSMFCKGDVIFYTTGASREEQGLLCDNIYFSYSWELNRNAKEKICW